jgi:hypothetical protein
MQAIVSVSRSATVPFSHFRKVEPDNGGSTFKAFSFSFRAWTRQFFRAAQNGVLEKY